jgi:hypothetical protein
VFSPQPPAICEKGFASQFIRSNYENSVRLRVPDVDNFQVSAIRRLANRNA